MRIGIDIDDTVSKTFEYLSLYIFDKLGYDISKEQDIYFKNDDIYNLLKNNSSELFLELDIKEDAVKVINDLKEKGHEIYFITARSNRFFKDPYDTTSKWLLEKGFKYNKLIVAADNKDEICSDNRIDIFFDDTLSHVTSVSDKNIASYLFTSIYNKDILYKNRVNSWLDIEKLITNM